jgi:cytosine/adenosine deaminase-related metal-dependent hydrolase
LSLETLSSYNRWFHFHLRFIKAIPEPKSSSRRFLAAIMLYINATTVTVNSNRDVYLNGAILVTENLIKDVGRAADLLEKYPEEQKHDLAGHIIIPGLISTHMHTAQTLLRGKWTPYANAVAI